MIDHPNVYDTPYSEWINKGDGLGSSPHSADGNVRNIAANTCSFQLSGTLTSENTQPVRHSEYEHTRGSEGAVAYHHLINTPMYACGSITSTNLARYRRIHLGRNESDPFLKASLGFT